MVEPLVAHRTGSGPRVVLVHGFTQTGRSWAPLAGRLASSFEVVAVDAPGHGDSGHVTADIAAGAAMLGAAGGTAAYVGYSMGARLCLHLAVARPDLVSALVLVSGTAGIADDTERAARRSADDALAASIERDGLDEFLARWLAQPLFATLPASAAGVADRRRNTAAGLAASLRTAGAGSQAPLWDRLAELVMPVLLVVGERDAKYVELADRMRARIPEATLAIVPGAGHAVHLERPDEFLAVLGPWLAARPSPHPGAPGPGSGTGRAQTGW